MFAAPAEATTIYWRDFDGVERADLSVSNPVSENLVSGLGFIPAYADVTLDVASNRMFFGSGIVLRSADLDGNNVTDLILGNPSAPKFLKAVALDVPNDKMYLTHVGPSSVTVILEANLNGPDATTVAQAPLEPLGLALDAGSQQLYWAKRTVSTPGAIQRMNVDGTGQTNVYSNLQDPYGIALDLTNDKIYWTDAESNKIQRGSLDGSGPVEDIITTDLDWPNGIALDLLNGKIYWSDYTRDVIERSNLDGSAREVVLSGLDSPSGISLIITLDATELAAVPEPTTGGLLSLVCIVWIVARRSRVNFSQ